jgi:hypothetical protein
MSKLFIIVAVIALWAGAVRAEEVSCKGNITSVQGEGMVTQSYRFEVAEVTGSDIAAVLDKCKKIAQERQNRAARKNPAQRFRKFSQIDLTCVRGTEKFPLKSTLQTGR